ncbi:MAG: DUF1573 domain-containing protein [Rubripirellula sp.]
MEKCNFLRQQLWSFPIFLLCFSLNFQSAYGDDAALQPDIARKVDTELFKLDVGILPTKKKINLGDLEANTTYRIRIEISNQTTKELSIAKVETTCGCMREASRSKPIAPNELGFVNIMFHAPSLAGSVGKQVNICFDEDCTQVLSVQIRGKILPTFVIEPSPIKLDSEQSAVVAISPRKKNSGYEIIKLESLRGVALVGGVERTEKGWASRVEPTSTDSWERNGYEVLRVRYQEADGRESVADVPIRIDFYQALSVFPSVVIAERKEGQCTAKFTVKTDKELVEKLILEGDRQVTQFIKITKRSKMRNGGLLYVTIDPAVFEKSKFAACTITDSTKLLKGVKVVFRKPND